MFKPKEKTSVIQFIHVSLVHEFLPFIFCSDTMMDGTDLNDKNVPLVKLIGLLFMSLFHFISIHHCRYRPYGTRYNTGSSITIMCYSKSVTCNYSITVYISQNGHCNRIQVEVIILEWESIFSLYFFFILITRFSAITYNASSFRTKHKFPQDVIS